MGCFDINFRTENVHEREIWFNHGKVSMPIVSLRLWAQAGHKNILEAESGEYVHVELDEADPFVAKHGVYFMKLRVNNKILGRRKGLGRPGPP